MVQDVPQSSRKRRATRPGVGRAVLAAVGASWLAAGVAEAQLGFGDQPSIYQDYTVQAGDVLTVFVWREPELSGPFAVRLDGRITMPLLGDVEARNQTPMAIAAEIRKRLERYLEGAEVAVGVAQANGARFFVIGQIGGTGQYPLLGPTTVVQALSLAGGFATFAKRDKIIVIRHTGVPQGNISDRVIMATQVLPVDYSRIEKGDTSQNYVLQPGDTIVVP